MFKIGDRVGVEVKGEKLYGWIIDVDEAHGSVGIAIGKNRIVNVRVADVSYDEGYKKLKQEKFT